jgi:hypothetical protein
LKLAGWGHRIGDEAAPSDAKAGDSATGRSITNEMQPARDPQRTFRGIQPLEGVAMAGLSIAA